VTKVSIEFDEKEFREKKGGYEYKAEHKPRSACNTGRKTGEEENIHTTQTHRNRQTDKEWA